MSATFGFAARSTATAATSRFPDNCLNRGLVCVDSGDRPVCQPEGGCPSNLCSERANGDTFCAGTRIVGCGLEDGCLAITAETECADAGLSCDDTGATPICAAGCDDPLCIGQTADSPFCSDGDSVVCSDDGTGCLQPATTACGAAGCDDAAGECIVDCVDHPACGDTGGADNDTTCDGYATTTCSLGSDGCFDAVQTWCSPGVCAPGTPPACVALSEDGDSCAAAIPVLDTGFVYKGDFSTLTDTETFVDDKCQQRPSGHAEVIFSVFLRPGDLLSVAELGDADTVRDIQPACGGALECTVAADDPDDQPLLFTATSAETVYVVVESFDAVPKPERPRRADRHQSELRQRRDRVR